MSFLSRIFGKPKSVESVVDAEKVNFSQQSQRTDKAWVEISKNPNFYKSAFVTSKVPICPYCDSSLDRKEPTKRSKFLCPKCKKHIWVDPYQTIFPSIYLKSREGLIAKHLDILNVGKFRMGVEGTVGTEEDFWYSADQLEWTKGKRKITAEEGAGDVLWRLYQYNNSNFVDLMPPKTKDEYELHIQWLLELEKEYSAEEKILKKENGNVPNKKKEYKSGDDSLAEIGKIYSDADFDRLFVALRKVIREKLKDNRSIDEDLKKLYIAQCSKNVIYKDLYNKELGLPTSNLMDVISYEDLVQLNYEYKIIGYDKIDAKKTDVKWYKESWGEPDAHNHPQDIYSDYFSDVVKKFKENNPILYSQDR